MSIINEAIKKARKEFEIGKKDVIRDIVKEEKLGAPISKFPRRNRKAMPVGVSLVLLVGILGSLFLYRHMSRLNVSHGPTMAGLEKDFPAVFSQMSQRSAFPAVEIENIAKLNGIVYGTEEKWAIINDKIVREGDPLLDGKLALIAKDFVRIERDNGEEIILKLR